MTDILIIEDTKELACLLRDFLKKEGFTVKAVYTGEDGIQLLNQEEFRLILLDIMLPNMDGFEVCSQIREDKSVPLFILSARNNKEDKLNGLQLGADDYIEKPFDIDILVAKIKACFNRYYNKEQSSILRSGYIELDTKKHMVFNQGQTVNCTVKEYELLKLFMENQGKTLTKEWIFNRVWGVDSNSEPSTLTVHVKWLREKLEKEPKMPKKLITVWGVGYRFQGDGEGE